MFVTLRRQSRDVSSHVKKCGVLCSMMIITFSLLLLLVFLATYAVSTHQKINIVFVDFGQPVYKVDDKFLSIALDSSVIADGFRGFNMTDPKLIKMTAALAPAYMRIGGTMADRLIFEEYGEVNHNIQILDSAMDSGTCSNEIIDCKMDFPNFTMNGEEWLTLNNFAKNAGVHLVFDLNALRRFDNGSWDSTNAEELIRFSSKHNLLVHWELGNEPNSFRHKFDYQVNASQLGNDFNILRRILRKYPLYASSLLVGPDTTRPREDRNESQIYLGEFLDEARIDAVTWHQYYLNGRTAKPADFMDPQIMNELRWQIDTVRKIVLRSKSSKNSIWLGETSSAYGGGAPCLSDRFVGSFIWLDKLGLAAKYGVDVVMRQSLFKGNYALIDYDGRPNPDWWISVVYKLLVDSTVLPCYIASSPKVRLYCHCSNMPSEENQHHITIFGFNLDKTVAKIRFEGIYPMNSDQSVNLNVYSYILSPEISVFSRNVLLNGQLLHLSRFGEIPPLKPNIVSAYPYVELPGYSVGFWTIPSPKAHSCPQ